MLCFIVIRIAIRNLNITSWKYNVRINTDVNGLQLIYPLTIYTRNFTIQRLWHPRLVREPNTSRLDILKEKMMKARITLRLDRQRETKVALALLE